METVRVATLNLWNRSGPWEQRLPLIRTEIERLAPDLLGLQEALRLGDRPDRAGDLPPAGAAGVSADQCAEVGAGLFAQVAYGRAWDMGGGLSFGNGLLSRFPIAEHAVFELPGTETGETRCLLYALVEHPLGPLPVFVTHLNWKLHHGATRLRQVQCVFDRIKTLCPIDDSRLPPILMGDFNAEPDSDEIRFLRGLSTVDGRSVYMADAWQYAGQGPGFTFDRDNRFAALAHEPPRRIDYVFVRGPDRHLRGEPIRTFLAFDQPVPGPDGPIWPSDHFGVVSDLVVSRRSI